MTLRLRLALLVTALLGVVLAAAGAVLVRLDARDLDRRLEDRVRQRVGAFLATALTVRAAPAGGDAPLPPPRPPGDEEPPPPPPAPAPPAAEAAAVRPLGAEPDGAHIEILVYEVLPPGAGDAAEDPVLRTRASTGEARLDPAVGRSRAARARAPSEDRLAAAGRTWVVWTQPVGPAPAEPPRPRRAPLAGPDGPRPPRGPPRRPVVVAFLETGPAEASHAAYAVRTALIGLAALLAGGSLAFLLAGRMLRPVREAAEAAERVARPDQRLPAPTSDDELARLVAVLNGMLGRLEAGSERERRFLATASHELRRPLTALLGELELASAPGRAADALRESLGLALSDARSMARLVDDLLHHARAQAGTLRLAERDADLVDLVAEAVDRSLRTVGRATRVEVGALPAVVLRADPDALRQVLENLVVNAATHGGEGVAVRVAGEVEGDVLRLHVEDDGPGIQSDDLARIFEPFGRGDRARTVPGFGLGLSIARDLVEAHGGRLTAASPAHADAARPGARFTVDLPASRIVRAAAGAD